MYHERQQWDYYTAVIEHGSAGHMESQLCEFGAGAWELVQIIEGKIDGRVQYVAVFKRPRI